MDDKIINNSTKLMQQAICFADGKDGYFQQTHSLFADDKKTGIIINVTGNCGKKNTKRIFFVEDKTFEDVKDAFIAAGYKWEKTA